jgi:hypothetical protein
LRELTRGVFPTQLARVGLEPVLRTLVARTDPAPNLQVTDAVNTRRFSPRVETAVYFCCAEAVRRGAGSITVAVADDELVVDLRGSCAAPDVASTVLDRVEAADGTLAVERDELRLRFPVGEAVPV